MTTDPASIEHRRVIDDLLLTTKQVRKRLDFGRPVPRELLLECIDIASRAPTGGNRERNNWLIVEDASLKAQIAEIYRTKARSYFESTDQGMEAGGNSKVRDSSKYLAEHLHEVPAMVFPIRRSRVDDATHQERAGWYGSILPAVWSFQLALRSRGIGSCWTTLHLDDERQVAHLLGIPDDVTQVAMLPVGYYTGDGFSPAPRRPAAEITFLDRWGASVDRA